MGRQDPMLVVTATGLDRLVPIRATQHRRIHLLSALSLPFHVTHATSLQLRILDEEPKGRTR
jgi:hypothetical protein